MREAMDGSRGSSHGHRDGRAGPARGGARPGCGVRPWRAAGRPGEGALGAHRERRVGRAPGRASGRGQAREPARGHLARDGAEGHLEGGDGDRAAIPGAEPGGRGLEAAATRAVRGRDPARHRRGPSASRSAERDRPREQEPRCSVGWECPIFCAWGCRQDGRRRAPPGPQRRDDPRSGLEAFDGTWGRGHAPIARARRCAREEVALGLALGPEVRRVIDATDAVGTLVRVTREATGTRGPFPSERAAERPIRLASERTRGRRVASEDGRRRSARSPSCPTTASSRSAAEGRRVETDRWPMHGTPDTLRP